ncbi:MATE family efflux transporter [Sphingomonas cavernae]|uniref:MATE family efflux transporter n=1 Tax=Sphingomonas cavernae TaxID=2320861 RepID=A0A418WS62_9SPHN|nr:MATE family efflux transporter [Sphingomonas cavernae]RJF94009.1 MATE family efflux transporter [Sphingomonas cavernae]
MRVQGEERHRGAWRHEAGAMLRLALPLILGNLAWSAIHATDLILVGRMGADSLAAAALGVNLYNAFLIFGMGLVMAASPMIASERGRRLHSVRDIRRTVRQTMWAAATICVPIWVVLWHGEAILLAMGQDPALSADAGRFLRALQWALFPFLLHLTLRNYISALEKPIWGVVVVVSTVAFNLLACWILIFGKFGAPALGLVGAGIGSTLSGFFMFFGMLAVVYGDRRFRRYHLFGRFWVPDWPRYRDVWKLGLPIAITLGLEVTVFNAAVFLMGLIDKPSLAAHAIAIQIAALSFMVPMGLAQAGTVRVGIGHGRRDPAMIARAGWTALAMGVGFMCATAILLIAAPRLLIGIFLDLGDPANAQVAALAVSFLAVAALFQIVDGAQVVGAGVLRGLQDTRVPMLFAAVGYWVIGIGVGTIMAFTLGFRGVGIWLGLASGLAAVAVLMVARWTQRERLGLVPHRIPPGAAMP